MQQNKHYMMTGSGIVTMMIMATLVMIFVLLKKFGVITWDWIWIVSPWWIPSAVSSAIYIVLLSLKIVKQK